MWGLFRVKPSTPTQCRVTPGVIDDGAAQDVESLQPDTTESFPTMSGRRSTA